MDSVTVIRLFFRNSIRCGPECPDLAAEKTA